MQPISFGAMLRIKGTPAELWEQKGEDNYKKTGTYVEESIYINPDQVTRVETQITREDVYHNDGCCMGMLRGIVIGKGGAIIHLSDGEEIELDSPAEKVIDALYEAQQATDRPYIDFTA